MHPKDLTASQLAKLEEMCSVLFPNTPKKTIYFIFAWMELSWQLLNHLCAYKKLSPIEIRDAVQLYGLVCFNQFPQPHPIDYLYEIFKSK